MTRQMKASLTTKFISPDEFKAKPGMRAQLIVDIYDKDDSLDWGVVSTEVINGEYRDGGWVALTNGRLVHYEEELFNNPHVAILAVRQHPHEAVTE